MDKIRWCVEKGMKLVEPNDDLARAYFKKARQCMLMIRDETPDEWKVISAYYAMYDGATGLLEKVGVRSEIHSCTIEVLRMLKIDAEILKEAKEARIQCQYKIVKKEKLETYLRIIPKAQAFIQRCEELAATMTDDEINRLSDKIMTLQKVPDEKIKTS